VVLTGEEEEIPDAKKFLEENTCDRLREILFSSDLVSLPKKA